jgi:L-gulonolactone oxidase
VLDGPPQPRGTVRRVFEDVVVDNGVLGLVTHLGKRFPSRIPQLLRLLSTGFSRRVRVDRSDRVFASPRLVHFTEMELAFPREAAAQALPAILEASERFPVVFPIEVRFVAGDDAFLSPASGRDTVYIAVHNLVGMPWEAFFRAVQEIGDAHGARPHWGKRHFHTAETLAPRYPDWDRFRAIRAEFDPEGRFANAYVRRVLG